MQPNLSLASEYRNIAYVLLNNDKQNVFGDLLKEIVNIYGETTNCEALATYLLTINAIICEDYAKDHDDYEYLPNTESEAINQFNSSKISIPNKEKYEKYIKNDVCGSTLNKFYKQLYFMKDGEDKEYLLRRIFDVIDYASNSNATFITEENEELIKNENAEVAE